MKVVPVLGTAVLIGAIVQVLIGFQVTGGAGSLVGAHMLIGLLGLVLVVALTVAAFRMKVAGVSSKVMMVVLTLLVLLQVWMGFQLLGGAESLIMSHEWTGVLIVVLAVVMGGVSMMSARRRTQT